MLKIKLSLFVLFIFMDLSIFGQGADLKLVDFHPVSNLRVKQTEILTPKFPVIDIHTHLRGSAANAAITIEEMDKAGVVQAISLDGSSKDNFYQKHLEDLRKESKDRFIVFFAPNFEDIDVPDFGKKEAAKLEEAVKFGCRGLKISKALGLNHRDKSGKLIPVDDPRIDPIWAKCGELGIPVLIHTADPVAFFSPIDQYNERYENLFRRPNWSFADQSKYPTRDELIRQRNNMFARHPNTIFIGAHVADLAEDLGQVSMWFEQFPNYYADISARIKELGRQPFTARRFLIKYQDRILFGTDWGGEAGGVEMFRMYYRFLETDDEYIDTGGVQGRWMIYGVFLPDEALEKIYNGNAIKLFKLKK